MRGAGALLSMGLCLAGATEAAAEAPGIETGWNGLVFFRPEVATNRSAFLGDVRDVEFNFVLRADLAVEVYLPRNVRAVINVQSFGTYTKGGPPLTDGIRLFEGFFEMTQIGGTPLELRIGRQQLGAYGNEMIIGDREFQNGLSFEAARLRWAGVRTTSDLFWAQLYRFVPDDPGETWRNPVLIGTYTTVAVNRWFGIDGYFLAVLALPNGLYRTNTLSAGARVFGEAGGFDWSAELAYQFGSGSTDDATPDATIGAYAAEGTLGYTFGSSLAPRLGLSYYRASGDEDPADDTLGSFNTLWQDEHPRFGYIDIFKGTNVQVVTATATAQLSSRTDAHLLGAHGVFATVVEPNDTSHQIFLGGSIPPGVAPRSVLGAGGDLFFSYGYSDALRMTFSAALFKPGSWVEDVVGTADLVVSGWAHAQVTF